MKLNPDCIRDVVLSLEEILSWHEEMGRLHIHFSSAKGLCNRNNIKSAGYSYEEVAYSVFQLSESGYIVADIKYSFEGATVHVGNILYITPKGHEFISTVHDKESWEKKIKPVLGAFGSVSLSIIESVSKGVATAVVEKLIQMNR